MTKSSEALTPALLRDWPLPALQGSKYARGQVLVVGGARGTPGAVMLSGLAAMRVGGGRLSLAVAQSVAAAVAVSVPEAGVVGLEETSEGSIAGDVEPLSDELARADGLLVGPGLDDPERARILMKNVLDQCGDAGRLVVDAYAIGCLPDLDTSALRGRLVLTPNVGEAATLLDCEADDVQRDVRGAATRISRDRDAVVTMQGVVCAPDGAAWQVTTGHAGLATSGSGDVLAGATVGLLARGADLAQAACWATYLHAAAGDRLAARVGATGFLARELLDELPSVMVELIASSTG